MCLCALNVHNMRIYAKRWHQMHARSDTCCRMPWPYALGQFSRPLVCVGCSCWTLSLSACPYCVVLSVMVSGMRFLLMDLVSVKRAPPTAWLPGVFCWLGLVMTTGYIEVSKSWALGPSLLIKIYCDCLGGQ